MSWLIEAYLDEGKHGPDHPESRNMRDKYDFDSKKSSERMDKLIDNGRAAMRFDKKYDNDDNFGDNLNDKDYAEINKNQKLQDEYLSKFSTAHKAVEPGQKVARIMDKASAIERHNKKYPDKKVVNAATDMLM